jgi:hypothetical protein
MGDPNPSLLHVALKGLLIELALSTVAVTLIVTLASMALRSS